MHFVSFATQISRDRFSLLLTIRFVCVLIRFAFPPPLHCEWFISVCLFRRRLPWFRMFDDDWYFKRIWDTVQLQMKNNSKHSHNFCAQFSNILSQFSPQKCTRTKSILLWFSLHCTHYRVPICILGENQNRHNWKFINLLISIGFLLIERQRKR